MLTAKHTQKSENDAVSTRQIVGWW